MTDLLEPSLLYQDGNGKELEHMLQERLRQLSLSSLKRRLRVCGNVSLQPTAT